MPGQDPAKGHAAALLSNLNNTSTIDTLLEKERDAQFLDRLDRQTKSRGQGSNVLDKSVTIGGEGEHRPAIRTATGFS